MQYGININGDNRNLNVSLGMKKEEGEPNFFENLGKNILELGKVDDDIDLIDQVEDEVADD